MLVDWRLDRLGRTVKGMVDLEQTLQGKGIQFRCLTGGIDTSTTPGTRTALSANAWDAYLILDKAIPEAHKKARPRTIEFRNALRDALESVPGTTVTGGVLDYILSYHCSYKDCAPIILKVVNRD